MNNHIVISIVDIFAYKYLSEMNITAFTKTRTRNLRLHGSKVLEKPHIFKFYS